MDVASIPVQDAIRMGSPSAKKTVIVLSDPTCRFCRMLHGEIKKAVAKDADVAFLVMPYPREKSDKATYRKCLAVVCSKSVKLLDDAYAGKELPEAVCKTAAVDETIRLAERLRIEGTPTMILPDGRMISGYMDSGGASRAAPVRRQLLRSAFLLPPGPLRYDEVPQLGPAPSPSPPPFVSERNR